LSKILDSLLFCVAVALMPLTVAILGLTFGLSLAYSIIRGEIQAEYRRLSAKVRTLIDR